MDLVASNTKLAHLSLKSLESAEDEQQVALCLLPQSVLTRPLAQHLCLSPLITNFEFIFQHFSLDERQFHQSSPTHRLFLGIGISSDGRNKSHHHTPLQ
jgi:hypothetical protein